MRDSYRERLVIQAPKVSDSVFIEEKHLGCSLSITGHILGKYGSS